MKKDNFFRLIFIFCFIFIAIFAIFRVKPVETNLLKAFSGNSNTQTAQLLKLANFSALKVNVIFESKNPENLDKIKSDFLEKISTSGVKTQDFDFSKLVDMYSVAPQNFLSKKSEMLLKNKNYTLTDKLSLERIYNPLGFFILPPDIDPYLFVTDFVMNLQDKSFENNEYVFYNGNYYSLLSLNLTSLDKANSQIKEIIQAQKALSLNSKIILEGAPVHSYIESQKSSFEINIICTLSTLALILLCKFYFKSYKILIPIALSISCGMILGYLVTVCIFKSVHVLTFVFSTTLIGIGLDYSIHYILTNNETEFKKNLTSSMLTTVFAFLILIFSGLEILKQIAIFTGFGLIGVYLFVTLFLPLFKFPQNAKFGNFKRFNILKYKKIILASFAIIIILGLFKLNFNDDMKNLYTPPKKLLNAEILYKKAFNVPDTSFITIYNQNSDKILEEEEKIGIYLDKKNIKYFSLSKLLPSIKKQNRNSDLTKNLYLENLSTYANFLDRKTVLTLKKECSNKKYVKLDLKKYPILNNFMIDKNTSFMVLYNAKDLDLRGFKNVYLINVSKDMSEQLKFFRQKCLKILPFMFIGLFIFLIAIYKTKKAVVIFIPPLVGTIFPIAFLSLFNQQLNLFNILSLVLIMGFSLDYSIFRANGGKKSNDAVLISCISTVFSFFLLSFTSFKLISSLGETLFLGILASYILSLLLISGENEEIEHM
jgi:predicted exporter